MHSLFATPYVPGQARGILRFNLAAAAPGAIVVLRQHELTALSARPAGIILINASPLSHPALRLLGLGIPTVLAEPEQLEDILEGTEILLDGHNGLLSYPAPEKIPGYLPPAPPETGKPVYTQDGARVELRASIGSIEASTKAVDQGAASIGLVRSEYLFPEDGSQPDTAFLAAAFEQICQASQPLPVSFRLLDIAGDKKPPWLGEVPGIAGVLGLQGARLYNTSPLKQIYQDELKALSKLVERYRFSIILPYVTSTEELERLVIEIRKYLPASVPVGVMLETPAAALSVKEFLSIADFAALGCNDLMQCLFAADRDLPELRDWLDPYAPALYRFLCMVLQQAGSPADKIQVCGLLPQWPGTLPALLGLGFRNFSVDPIMIPWLAQTVHQVNTKRASELAQKVCLAQTAREVKQFLLETGKE